MGRSPSITIPLVGLLALGGLGNIFSVGSLPARPGSLLFLLFAVLGVLKPVDRRVIAALRFGSIAVLFSGVLQSVVTQIVDPLAQSIPYLAMTQTLALLSLLGSIAFAYLAQRVCGPLVAILVIALPLLVNPIATDFLVDVNAWKFWLAWPISITVLVVLGRRIITACITLFVLAAVAFALDYRSAGVISSVALLVELCSAFVRLVAGKRKPSGRKPLQLFSVATSYAGGLAVGVLAIIAIGSLYTTLATAGVLGNEVAEKQIAQSGSSSSVFDILAGGRAELPVSINLLSNYPFGLGVGTLPNSGIVSGAQEVYVHTVNGNSTLEGGSPNSVITETFVEVHSILFDAWLFFGSAGVALVLALLVVIVRSVRRCIVGYFDPRYEATYAFVALWALWNIFFSPLRGNWYDTGMAAGLLMAAGPSTRPFAPRRNVLDSAVVARVSAER